MAVIISTHYADRLRESLSSRGEDSEPAGVERLRRFREARLARERARLEDQMKRNRAVKNPSGDL